MAVIYVFALAICLLFKQSYSAIYTYEDVELRRVFPSEFPQDTVRRSGSLDAEHLGRYNELKSYFYNPKSSLNKHFEELQCFNKGGEKLCKIDLDRYSPSEYKYYISSDRKSEGHMDRRRIYCFMMICFNEDELDRLVASF